MDEISNLHNKLDENLKVYDQKFGINEISNHFYDMPKTFKSKYIELLKLQVRNIIGQDLVYDEICNFIYYNFFLFYCFLNFLNTQLNKKKKILKKKIKLLI